MPKKNRIVLLRHGASVWNEMQIHQGQCFRELGLSEKGYRQAEITGRFFKDSPVICIWSSPLPRAMQTASIIRTCLPHKTPVFLNDDLMEISNGVVDGMPFSEIKKLFPDGWSRWEKKIFDKPLFPRGEIVENVLKRIVRAHEGIVNEAYEYANYNFLDEATIIVVSHGAVNSLFLAHIDQSPLEKAFEKFPQDNACINVLVWDSETKTFSIEKTNNTTHLGQFFFSPKIKI